jgi:hypothetical protein
LVVAGPNFRNLTEENEGNEEIQDVPAGLRSLLFKV